MPRWGLAKQENIITGERFPKRFAVKIERALPSGAVHAHTYDARTLTDWWRTGRRSLPHLGDTDATPAEQRRVAAVLAAQPPGRMERFRGKPSTRVRSNLRHTSSVNWSASGARTPNDLVHHTPPAVARADELQAVKRVTDSMLRKLYRQGRYAPSGPYGIQEVHARRYGAHESVGARIKVLGATDHTENGQVIRLVVRYDGFPIVTLTITRSSKARLHLHSPRAAASSVVSALHVMLTRQILGTLRSLDPKATLQRHEYDHYSPGDMPRGWTAANANRTDRILNQVF